MVWALAGLGAVAVAGWRFGMRGVLAVVLPVWLGGLGWLATRTDPAAGETLRWWAVAGGVVLLGLGYAALVGLMRRKARVPETAALTDRPAGVWPRPGEVGGAADLMPRSRAPASTAADPVAPDDPVPPSDPASPLSDAELDRYARHIVLRELGGAGQRRLRAARVLVVGAGGLGAPVLQYLAAAGVGRITVSDDDTVSLSNLQRQVIFATADIGRPKAGAAAGAMRRLNPHVAVTPLSRRITADDAALVAQHDLVLDGTDSFASRAAVNAACVAAGVPLIAGAIAQWEGQVALYDPARGGPCLACLFPEAPAPGLALPCAEAGVVGALPGVIGSLMALEAIKHLAGVVKSGAGEGLRGRMLIVDGLWGDTRRVTMTARPGCAVCGGGS